MNSNHRPNIDSMLYGRAIAARCHAAVKGDTFTAAAIAAALDDDDEMALLALPAVLAAAEAE